MLDPPLEKLGLALMVSQMSKSTGVVLAGSGWLKPAKGRLAADPGSAEVPTGS